jgi:hypothetical protein
MRRAPVLAALAAAVAFAAPLVAQTAPSLTGTWELTSEGPRGPRTPTFTFTQDGAALTGSTQMRDNTVEIKDGKVDGNNFTFTLEVGMGDRTFSQVYKGTVNGEAMEGTVTGPRGDTPFKGARKKS